MKKLMIVACVIMSCAFTATSAMADNIKGRIGVTGLMGFIVPSDSDNISTDVGFIGGGGILYGLVNNLALEMEVTYASYGSEPGIDFNTTNISLGAQYRFSNLPDKNFVPYLGSGLDILVNGIDNAGVDVDTVVGMHVKGGFDYFITKQLAATVEMKGVLAPDADINDYRGRKVGNFDPMSFSTLFGVRFFLN